MRLILYFSQQTMLDLPGLEAPEEKLRVCYTAASEACAHLFVPCDKSVPENFVAQTVWREAKAIGAGLHTASAFEDWTDIGGLGRCWVETVALPLHAATPQSVFCLLRP
ncbi:hypothetical protein BH23GEM7_BH23GEM7_01900 [soil metagenome]